METAGKGSEAERQMEAWKGGNMGDNPEDCPVCLMPFDDSMQRPRTLPCGHTVCTPCMNRLKEQGHVTCPECCVRHAVPEGGHFPVSYTIEALIRRMRVTEVAVSALLPPSVEKGKEMARAAGWKEAGGLSKKMCSFLQEQEARVVATITTCQELQLQLDQYQTTLTGWGEQQEQLEDGLQGLVAQSRTARELVGLEKSRVAARKEEVKKGEQQLHATLETLRILTTEQEAGMAVTEVFRVTGEAEQVVEECQESFPDTDTVTTVRKVREASSAALEAFQAIQAVLETHSAVTTQELSPLSDPKTRPQSDPGLRPQSTPELRPQSDPETRPQSDPELRPQSDPETRPQSDLELRPQSDSDSSIMDKLQVTLTPNLKAEDLRSLTQPARSLLEAGRVFAVHQVEGRRRYARISLEAGQLYLHALKEHPPPPGTATLQMSEVVPPSPPCMVFLDLSWPGSTPRRVQIRLSCNTSLGRQFVLLCTGQSGPSYANTRLLGVKYKGQPGERVYGGDYESNDGRGGAALLPDLDEGDYKKSGQAGAVWGRWRSTPVRGAQFVITTRHKQPGDVCVGVFAEVVTGMDAVVAAARHSNIKEVMVVDCGVMLLE